MEYLLGLDIGSSSVKVALLDIATGRGVAAAQSPDREMPISAPQPGFAEQDPNMWWEEFLNALQKMRRQISFQSEEVKAIGISYQMHGLVCVDANLKPIRPSIIWCDSRAVAIGNKAMEELGPTYCLDNFLNSPGNFTASKLKWVKDNEPANYARISRVMLPGDYMAMRLTGETTTTIPGLSEGILWNFKKGQIAEELLDYYGIDPVLLSPLVPACGEQGRISENAAALTGLQAGTPITYRAGDQPNNAWSLNALEPGEVAATAGTSGVVYGVTNLSNYDPLSRVNTFVHVNHRPESPRYGVLLCINGTGILNSWLRKNFFGDISYEQMNAAAAGIPVGSEALRFYPFGNGAERVLENRDPGAMMRGLQFNRHHRGHLARAAQEGIVFALQYGMEVMLEMGLEIRTVRAGHANMFLSEVFASTFANVSGARLELFNTDGALGAARGAGLGASIYTSPKACFIGMERVKTFEPDSGRQACREAYHDWKAKMN